MAYQEEAIAMLQEYCRMKRHSGAMPARLRTPPARYALQWLVRVVMLVVLSWCTWVVVVASGLPGAYPFRSPFEEFQYPFGTVVAFLGLMISEMIAVDMLLPWKSPKRIWRRAAIAAVALWPVASGPLCCVSEAPPYVSYHNLWLAFLDILLFLLALGSAIGAIARAAAQGLQRRT
jgi:hypothetical protein